MTSSLQGDSIKRSWQNKRVYLGTCVCVCLCDKPGTWNLEPSWGYADGVDGFECSRRALFETSGSWREALSIAESQRSDVGWVGDDGPGIGRNKWVLEE